jgi:hypothetical protein
VIRTTLVLVGHSLRRTGAIVAGVGLLLAAFQFLLTQVASYLLRTSAFGQLSMLVPDFVRTVAGPATLAFLSFGGIVALGYFHPIVIAAVVGVTIAIATEPAAEVERRFVDLTLARPIARAAVITRSVIVVLVAGGVLMGLMAAGTFTGLACCTPAEAERPSAALILSLGVNLASIMLCWSGVALAIAAFVRRRAVAGASPARGARVLSVGLSGARGTSTDREHAFAVSYFEPTAHHGPAAERSNGPSFLASRWPAPSRVMSFARRDI